MEKTVFRKSSMESLNSPEQLDNYIKAVSPVTWIVLAAIITFLCAVFAWMFFGCIYTRVEGVAVNENGSLYCYARVTDLLQAESGVRVTVNGTDYTVAEIPEDVLQLNPTQNAADELVSAIGRFSEEEWLVKIPLAENVDLEEASVDRAVITIEEIHPISFLRGENNG